MQKWHIGVKPVKNISSLKISHKNSGDRKVQYIILIFHIILKGFTHIVLHFLQYLQPLLILGYFSQWNKILIENRSFCKDIGMLTDFKRFFYPKVLIHFFLILHYLLQKLRR